MQIGLLCPVWFPVPPEAYGGIERSSRCSRTGSSTPGTTSRSSPRATRRRARGSSRVFHTAPSEWIGQTYWEMQHALHAFRKADEFDVMHDHTGMLGLAFGGLIDDAVLSHGARAARRAAGPHVRAGRSSSRRSAKLDLASR